MGFRVYRVSGLGFRCCSQPLFDPLVSGFKWDLMEGPEGCEQRGRVSNMDWTCCSPQCRVWGFGLRVCSWVSGFASPKPYIPKPL